MKVMGLSLDSSAKTPIVLLQSEEQEVLPIWVGAMEAMSISLALSEQNMPRPLTHDLFITLLDTLEASIESLEIHNFEQGMFYADILIRQGDITHKIDCRPSDGIALALRVNTPIKVHPNVLQKSEKTAQLQDGTSFKLLNENTSKDKTHEPAKLLTKIVHNIKHGAPKPNVHTNATQPSNEKELKELLQTLEPQSSRRM